MKNWVLIPLFFLVTQTFGQTQLSNDSLRVLFHQIETEEDLDELLTYKKEENNTISEAYFGSAIVMKAQYAFFPSSKYSCFKDGTKLIENSIRNSKSVENIYLRLLIQLNTPHFLGYYKDIDEDISFIAKNINTSSLSKHWKIKILENIIQFETEKYDFSSIKNKLAKQKE